MELTQLIEALSARSAYRHPVDTVEICQTHISVVFLAGPYAYKIKKPVDLGFLDFSTLEKRRYFCEQETTLNRRLSPDVYLGVVPIVQTPTGLQFEGEGAPIEWAVKMQRLPEAATFQERLCRQELSVTLVEEFARRVASFHRVAETNERIANFGSFGTVRRVLLDIFDQAAPQVGNTVSRSVFERVQTLTEETLKRLRPLIEKRAASGVPRDTHGDLHLDHVYYFPDRPPPRDLAIVDCIEFNDRFRYMDPIADMAFPVMDFAFQGRRDLARAFSEAYFAASDDEEGRALLSLYTAYRATVRGMVEGLLLMEKEIPDQERIDALARARAHWLLALGELEVPNRKPCLLIVAGLPGTGKSMLAEELKQQAGCCVVRSDVVRKELAGLPQTHRLSSDFYTPAWNERTYAACLDRVGHLLFEGKRVLVDATFHQENKRQAFLKLALRWGVSGVVLLCRTSAETVRKRLENRRDDASDADWPVYLHVAERWENVSPLTLQSIHALPTEGARPEIVCLALQTLKQLGLQE